jgi:hypothetical protein
MSRLLTTYTFTSDELTPMLNNGKHAFLQALIKEGVIDTAKAEEMSRYCIVVKDKTFFGSWWKQIWSHINKKSDDKTNDLYHVVKVIDMHSKNKKSDENTQT